VLADASALIIHVSVYTSLGFFFHRSLAGLFKNVALLQHVLFIAAIAVVGAIGRRRGAKEVDIRQEIHGGKRKGESLMRLFFSL